MFSGGGGGDGNGLELLPVEGGAGEVLPTVLKLQGHGLEDIATGVGIGFPRALVTGLLKAEVEGQASEGSAFLGGAHGGADNELVGKIRVPFFLDGAVDGVGEFGPGTVGSEDFHEDPAGGIADSSGLDGFPVGVETGLPIRSDGKGEVGEKLPGDIGVEIAVSKEIDQLRVGLFHLVVEAIFLCLKGLIKGLAIGQFKDPAGVQKDFKFRIGVIKGDGGGLEIPIFEGEDGFIHGLDKLIVEGPGLFIGTDTGFRLENHFPGSLVVGLGHIPQPEGNPPAHEDGDEQGNSFRVEVHVFKLG